jgi:hypothetical protein
MSDVTQIHEQSTTLHVEVNIPGHAPRTETSLFEHTRKELITKEVGCWVCGAQNVKEAPLEAHHFPVERSLATGWNWDQFKADCLAGLWGPNAKAFDWASFDPKDPYAFVDNMLVNGLLLCKKHHTGNDTGIHTMPHPLWVWQRYAPDGYDLSSVEVIHHDYSTMSDGV